MNTTSARRVAATFVLASLVVLAGCGRGDGTVVRSHLSGQITVESDVDSSSDYSGFHVVVSTLVDGGTVDTLAVAITAADGTFETDVVAPRRGVYPITIRRSGGILKQGQIVVADGDTATFSLTLPTGRPMSIRSKENAAWAAYRNTKAAHAETLRRLAQAESTDQSAFAAAVTQASNILWGLPETFPGTMAGDVSRVEAVVMLANWNDSLAVTRFRRLPTDSPGLVEAARATWRSQERLHGLDSALALLDATRHNVTDADARLAVDAERVVALMSAGKNEEALDAARSLRKAAGESDWSHWAESALYEIGALQPGLKAPNFSAVTRDGQPFVLDSLESEFVLLEFYMPTDEAYHQDLTLRASIQDAPDGAFQIVSVSLEPDPLLNEAFLDTRQLSGLHIVADGGMDGEIARLYNVKSVPKRFLLQDGLILARYQGRSLGVVVDDLSRSLAANP